MRNEGLLRRLIETKSYSGEEGQIRSFIKDWFAERGIDAFEQDENLLVHFEGRDRTRAFIFNSHMDTVSAGDESLWKYGPWNPRKEGKKLVGLGASDMKAGLAATMILAEKASKKGKLPVDVWFTYVVMEEIDGSGTSSFAEWFNREGYVKRYQDIAGIFTEPTNLVEIEHGHRGNIFLQVEIKGDSGHASRPAKLRKHAVRQMIAFADRLEKDIKKWRKEFPSDIFEPPTVGEMTSIYAGVKPKVENGELKGIGPESANKFPANCVATFDIRTIPGFHEVALDRLIILGKEMGAKVSLAYPISPSGYTDPSEKIVQVSKRVLRNPRLSVSQAAADMGFLTGHGVKAVILGPGEKEQAHKVNEYCYPEQIPQAVNIYQAIIEAWSK